MPFFWNISVTIYQFSISTILVQIGELGSPFFAHIMNQKELIQRMIAFKQHQWELFLCTQVDSGYLLFSLFFILSILIFPWFLHQFVELNINISSFCRIFHLELHGFRLLCFSITRKLLRNEKRYSYWSFLLSYVIFFNSLKKIVLSCAVALVPPSSSIGFLSQIFIFLF